jgi:predicted alpha/beta hydrolase family esterase
MESPARSYLLLHGWGGSGPEHWQSWLARRLRAVGEFVRYPSLPDSDDPQRDAWLNALHTELGAPPGERVVVCHSLAVLLWLHYARQPSVGSVARFLLVAPPGPSVNNPQVESFFPAPLDGAALRRSAREVLLVCSAADPFCPEQAALLYGAPLDIETQVLPAEARHINVAAGYGPWPWVEQWCLDPSG